MRNITTVFLLFILVLLLTFFAYIFIWAKHNQIAFLENKREIAATSTTPKFDTHNDQVYYIGTYKVSRIVDGDTIHVQDTNGNDIDVRFLAVNTPEIHNVIGQELCLGKYSASYTQKELTGKEVELWGDKTQPKLDVYKRTLAYVRVVGTSTEFFNDKLMEDGIARLYTKAHPHAVYYDLYSKYQDEAQKNILGIWNPLLCK